MGASDTVSATVERYLPPGYHPRLFQIPELAAMAESGRGTRHPPLIQSSIKVTASTAREDVIVKSAEEADINRSATDFDGKLDGVTAGQPH